MREDNERQKDLESVGWKFYRIPSKRWWINWEREKQQKEIMLEIKDAIEKEKERLSTKS
jgi:very-short-patch-repair endonuclease